MRYYVEYVEKVGERRKARRQGPWGEATARLNANHIAQKYGNVDDVRLVSADDAEKEFLVSEGWNDEEISAIQDMTCPLRRRGLTRLEDAPSHGLSRWTQSSSIFRPIVAGDLSVESVLDDYASRERRLVDERADDVPIKREETELKAPSVSALESRVDIDPDVGEDLGEVESASKATKGKRKKK